MQREPAHVRCWAGENPARIPAYQAWRDGEAQFVNQVGGGELRVEAGTALGQYAAVAGRAQQL